MRTIFRIVFILLFASGNIPAQEITEIHISPEGDLNADGSPGKPFGTLQEAIDWLSLERQKGVTNNKVKIWVHGGEYSLEKSIMLKGHYAGSVIISSFPGEKAVFFGGTILRAEWFDPVKDKKFIGRLVDEKAGKEILVVNLREHGITDFGEMSRHGWSIEPEDRIPPVSLSIGGKRMILARWPNPAELSPYMEYRHYLPEERELRGYELKIQSIIDKVKLPGEVTYQSVINPGDKIIRESRKVTKESLKGRGGTFQVAFDRMKYWHDVENIFLDGVLSSTWEWTYNKLASVNITQKTITLDYPELHGLGLGESVRLPHFHFQNIPEEIDIPGEYYIDRSSGLLYLYPPEDFSNQTIVLSMLTDPMVVMERVESVTISGLGFDSGRNLGFSIRDCDDVRIENCVIANFTRGGVDIVGTNIKVADSHIHGMGGFGVYLDGGDYETLEPARNEVLNCHIHDFGWDQKSQLPGVIVDGVGQRIAHNDIHDGPHFAIKVLMPNDVIIEYNEIHDLPAYHMFDGGSIYIYSGPRPESRGVEIRYNHFHDIPTIGIYPDNFTWGTKIYGNVFRNVGVLAGRAAVHVNGGGECRTFNNLVIDGVELYGQGARQKEPHWFDHWNRTLEKYGEGKVAETPYAKYPDFMKWLTKKEPDDFYRPVSHVYNNVFYHPNTAILDEADKSGILDRSGVLDVGNNWITKDDPGILITDNGRLSLLPDAPLYDKIPAFLTPPFDKMGKERGNAGVSFEREEVFSGATVHSAQAADFNGDGLLDLIFSASHAVNMALAPDFEVKRVYELPGPFKDASIYSNIMDVDGDGDMDFLGENRGLYWLECPDDPAEVESWDIHWISKEFTGTHCITVHDVDEDGKPDIIANNFYPPGNNIERRWPNKYPNSMIWFSVPEDLRDPTAWKPNLLADGDAIGGSHYIGFADLNGDGHDEALMGAKGEPFEGGDYFAYWSRGNKVKEPWEKTLLEGENIGATHLYGADLNGDGHMDMVGTLGHGAGLVYYEGPDFKPLYLDKETLAMHSFNMADIEGDGDIDLFVVAKGSEKVKWYENDGNARFTPHVLSENQSAYDIKIYDLEGDGDLDLLVAGQFTNNIVIFKQK